MSPKYWEDHDKSHNEDCIRINDRGQKKGARTFIVSNLKRKNSHIGFRKFPKNVYLAADSAKTKPFTDSNETLEVPKKFFSLADLSSDYYQLVLIRSIIF